MSYNASVCVKRKAWEQCNPQLDRGPATLISASIRSRRQLFVDVTDAQLLCKTAKDRCELSAAIHAWYE